MGGVAGVFFPASSSVCYPSMNHCAPEERNSTQRTTSISQLSAFSGLGRLSGRLSLDGFWRHIGISQYRSTLERMYCDFHVHLRRAFGSNGPAPSRVLSSLIQRTALSKMAPAFLLLFLHNPCCNSTGARPLDTLERYDAPEAATHERENHDCR
jgi:hypothetical protein